MKENLQERVNGLWVILIHLHQGAYPICPAWHLILKPLTLWFGITQLAAQVADACNNGEVSPLEETFGTLEVFLRDNQYALGRLLEITLGGRGVKEHYVVQVVLYVLNVLSHFRVVSIPQLGHLWMCIPELPYWVEDSDPVRNHRKWVALGETLLTVKEVPCANAISDHQYGAVAVSVEGELHYTGPLISELPQHDGLVLLIEQVLRIN